VWLVPHSSSGQQRPPSDAAPAAAAEPDGYYHAGALAGSLKSAGPLALYHSDPNHLWNRLFAALYVRPSELPGRPAYPEDTTQLDAWDRKLRNGQLPPGPVVKRIEGGDVIEFLAWPQTRYFSEPATGERVNRLLDQFLAARGETLITDPVRRAFFQRDLWAVFDLLVGQNIDRFGDADLARRRSAVLSYPTDQADAEQPESRDSAGFARREALCRKLAAVIQRLALPRSALDALPDNYAAAVGSGHFPSAHQFDPRRDYLPAGLFTRPDEWVELDAWPGTLRDQREGQLTLHSLSLRGRSYFRVFWRFPGGRRDVEQYLEYVRRDGVDWQKSAEQGFLALKPGLRQIPEGFEGALVQFLMALDDHLRPVPTRLVESVRLRVYKNVDGSPDPTTNTGRGMNIAEYVARRRLLFAGLKHGGLEREPDDLPQYRVILQEGVAGSRDWGRYGRQQTVAQQCLHCHMFRKDQVGVYSLYGHVTNVPGLELPAKQGVGIPLGSGHVRPYARGQREARWKVGQEDYLRLVEYARPAPAVKGSGTKPAGQPDASARVGRKSFPR
jgi:hypothetical protein